MARPENSWITELDGTLTFPLYRPRVVNASTGTQARLQQNAAEPGWRSHATMAREHARRTPPSQLPAPPQVPERLALAIGRQRPGSTHTLSSTGVGRLHSAARASSRTPVISMHTTPGSVSSASVGMCERGHVCVGGEASQTTKCAMWVTPPRQPPSHFAAGATRSRSMCTAAYHHGSSSVGSASSASSAVGAFPRAHDALGDEHSHNGPHFPPRPHRHL